MNLPFLACRTCLKTDESVKYNIFETVLEWETSNQSNNINEVRKISVADALHSFLTIDVRVKSPNY